MIVVFVIRKKHDNIVGFDMALVSLGVLVSQLHRFPAIELCWPFARANDDVGAADAPAAT